MLKYVSLKYHTDIKKTRTPIDFWDSFLGFGWLVAPKLCQNTFQLNISLYQKKLAPQLNRSKSDFWERGFNLEVFPEGGYSQIVSKCFLVKYQLISKN